MAITDPIVLPADVVLIPVAHLPRDVRARLPCAPGDYVVTRPHSRTRSKVVDARTARLLERFRTSCTIVEAVVRESRVTDRDPSQTLTEAFPVLHRLVRSRVLVPAGSASADRLAPSLRRGARIAGFDVLRCVQLAEDTEVYEVRNGDGRAVALKIGRPTDDPRPARALDRERAILEHLDGTVSPRLLRVGAFGHRPYVAMDWRPGVDAAAAAVMRQEGGAAGRVRLVRLCCAILDAYAHLHAQGVIHADVHQRNVLVGANGTVSVIDYGLARCTGGGVAPAEPERAGIEFLSEPEYASALRAGRAAPPASAAGEQYALAAMLYALLTGDHYVDFSVEQAEAMRQIAEDAPLPFSRRGVAPWPAVEHLLAVALRKDPTARFPSVAEFAQQLRAVAILEDRAVRVARRHAARWPASAARLLVDTSIRQFGRTAPKPAAPAEHLAMARCSAGAGMAGIAYALYRVALLREDAALLSLADIWSVRAASRLRERTVDPAGGSELTHDAAGRPSLLSEASGVHAVRALIATAMGDSSSQREAVQAFIAASRPPRQGLGLADGRSGALLGCALMADAAPEGPSFDRRSLVAFGDELFAALSDEMSTAMSVSSCRRPDGLGIARGWGGVLYAALRWCRSARRAPGPVIEGRAAELAECVEMVDARDWTPRWCDGSAGMVHLWTLAHAVFGAPSFLSLAERAAWSAWRDPDRASDLCCGLAGRSYALLNLYKHTADGRWLRRALATAEGALARIHTLASRGDSLYSGRLGVALLAEDVERPGSACMPLFEPEGWPMRGG